MDMKGVGNIALRKTTNCRLWNGIVGSCRFGDGCNFIHVGVDNVGNDNINGNQQRHSQSRSSRFSDNNALKSHYNGNEDEIDEDILNALPECLRTLDMSIIEILTADDSYIGMILNEDGSLNEEKVNLLKEGKLFNSDSSSSGTNVGSSGGSSSDMNQVVKTVKWQPGMPSATSSASQLPPPPPKPTNLFARKGNNDNGKNAPGSGAGYPQPQQQVWNPPDVGDYGMNMGMHMNQAYDPFQYSGPGEGMNEMMMNMNMPVDMNWGGMVNWGGQGGNQGGYGGYGDYGPPVQSSSMQPRRGGGIDVGGGNYDPRQQHRGERGGGDYYRDNGNGNTNSFNRSNGYDQGRRRDRR